MVPGVKIVAQVFRLCVLFWVQSQGAVAGVVGAFSKETFVTHFIHIRSVAVHFFHFVSSHFQRVR